MNHHSISVIIPVYNERETLERSLSRINFFLEKHFKDYEIILVESGSTDGTAEKTDELSRRIPAIRVIHEGKRNGFGSALKRGYREAKKDLVWTVPIDVPFALESILVALPYFPQYDAVLSYRSRDSRGLRRRIPSFIFNWLVKILFGSPLRHVNSAFKVFKRETLQYMKLTSNGWFIDAEIGYNIARHKIPFREIPVALIERSSGGSSVGARAYLDTLKEMWRFWKAKPRP